MAREASDGLCTMVLIVVAIGSGCQSSLVKNGCLIFLAAESGLAYAVAGIVKLRSRSWRSGAAMQMVMRSRCFGHPVIAKAFDRHSWAAVVTGWAVIIFECSMPVSPFLPRSYLLAMFGIGLAFHLGIAVVMGLGSFLWAFSSTYPAILWLNGLLWRS
jgi:hypothetical protein